MSSLIDFIFDNDNPYRFISGFNNQDGVTTPFFTDHIYLDDNDVLHAMPDFDITENLDEVNELLNSYADLLSIYHAKMRVYKGDHSALHQGFYSPLLKEFEKNMSINIPKNMVNTFAGFFAGIPAKVNYVPNGSSANDPLDDKSQKINDWLSNALNRSNYSDILFEWAKKADIYGHSYAISYLDKNDKVNFRDLSPENCLIVYDNSMNENQLFAIYFIKINGVFMGTLYTDEFMYDFGADELTDSNKFDKKQVKNDLGMIPVVEMLENDERMGLFDDAISAIDKLDKVYSLKFNDVKYFSNALLFLKGFNALDDDQQNTVQKIHVLQPVDKNGRAIDASDIDAKFLSKPQNDQQQQNFIHDISSQIYQNAQIINLSDPTLGASASGDALGKKLQPMVMLAGAKARKMTNAFKQIITIMLTQCDCLNGQSIDDVVADIQVKFTPNIPHSLLDESNIVKNLNNIVSLPTLLSYLSNINNVQQEISQINAEKQTNMQQFQKAGADDSNDGDYPDNSKASGSDDN